MSTLLVLAASIWTLTNSCSDDALRWDRPPDSDFEQACATWNGQTLCSAEPPLQIGCYEGEVRFETIDRFGNTMSSQSLPWLRKPGRSMEWEAPAPSCPVSSPGKCLKYDSTRRCLSWERPCPTGKGPPAEGS